MYFISVDDFDYLVRLVHDGRCGLAEAIKRIREADRERKTDPLLLFRYSLNNHFSCNKYMQMPKYLEDELEEVMKTLKEKLAM